MKINVLRTLASCIFTVGAVAAVARAEDPPAKPTSPPADAPTSKPAEPGPAKFYGTIGAIDEKAKTITIDSQVYHIVGETQMTKAADGAAATLADATVGEPARGSYTKTSDGAMNITKVRFGKKAGGGKGGKSGEKTGEKKAEKTADSTTQPQQ